MEKLVQINWKKSDLHKDALILLYLHSNQPVTPNQIMDKLGIPRSSCYERVKKLLESEVIRNISNEKEKSLVLWNYVGLNEIFNYLKKNYIKEVSIPDLANFVHKPPSEIEKRAFEIAGGYGIQIIEESDVYGKLGGGSKRRKSLSDTFSKL